jgi:glycosyltransferase involved in cell wall biosynthesis
MISRPPKVSILIPVYNGGDYLREAVESALGQTYRNKEIILINDGSSDSGQTDQICRTFAETHTEVLYIRKSNGGVGSALNAGINAMSGDYFSWLSHDDRYFPNKIFEQMRVLSEFIGQRLIVLSDYVFINEKGGKTADAKLPAVELVLRPWLALLHNYINGCTLLFHRRLFDEVGLFDEKLVTTQDYDLWLRAACKGYSFVHVPLQLLESRQHAKQGSKTADFLNEATNYWISVLDRVPDEIVSSHFGDRNQFFYSMRNFLSQTPFRKAADYADIRLKEEVRKNVRVSVIIAFYNQVAQVIRSISSVLRQTYTNYELILIDNDSTDDLAAILELKAGNSKIHLHHLAQDKRLTDARNYGINAASGTYLAFLTAGDEFAPEKLQYQIDFMQSKTSIFSHTSYLQCYSDFRGREEPNFTPVDSGKFDGHVFPAIITDCPIVASTVVVKKDIFDQAFRFPESDDEGTEIHLWIEISKSYRVDGISKYLSTVYLPKLQEFMGAQRLRYLWNTLNFLRKNNYLRTNEPELRQLASKICKILSNCP